MSIMHPKPKLMVILGPTSSGKSGLAVKIAREAPRIRSDKTGILPLRDTRPLGARLDRHDQVAGVDEGGSVRLEVATGWHVCSFR